MGNVRLNGAATNAYLWKPQDSTKFARWRRLVDARRAAGFEKGYHTALDQMVDMYFERFGPQGVKLAQGQVADLDAEVSRLVKLANEQDPPRRHRGTVDDAQPTKTTTSEPDNETEVERLARQANEMTPSAAPGE